MKKLAQITDIPYLTMYCLDNGTLRDIDLDHLLRLCAALGVTQEELIRKDYEL